MLQGGGGERFELADEPPGEKGESGPLENGELGPPLDCCCCCIICWWW